VRWFAGLALVVVSFAVYVSSGVETVSDSRWAIPAAISLERHGDLDLDEYRGVVQREGGYGVRTGSGGHTYYFFPYGTSVLIAPVVWLADVASGRTLEATVQRTRVDHWDRRLASAVTALAVGVFFFVALEILGSVGLALLASLTLAFGTAAWSTASRAMWMHGPDMLLLALVLLLAVLSQRRPVLAGVMALPLAFSMVVRPTNAAAVLCFSAWVVWCRRKQAPLFFGLAAGVAAVFFLANRAMFGQWLHPYYNAGDLGSGGSFFEALVGNLVSPGRGLFVYTPVLLLVLLRGRRFTPLEWAAAGTVLLHLLLISRFWHWWGGFAFGPRLFSDVLPLLVFLMLPVFPRLRARPPLGIAFGLLLAASVFVNWRGATRFETWLWNSEPVSVDTEPSRLWDWDDLQMLRGW
jgi:hypothetical protein